MTIQSTLATLDADNFPGDLWATMPDGVNRIVTQSAWLYIANSLTGYEGDANTLRDYVSEIADGAIPVYTHEKWREFNNYKLWNSNDVESEASDIVDLSGDLGEIQESILNAMLYSLYSRAGYALISWAESEATE